MTMPRHIVVLVLAVIIFAPMTTAYALTLPSIFDEPCIFTVVFFEDICTAFSLLNNGTTAVNATLNNATSNIAILQFNLTTLRNDFNLATNFTNGTSVSLILNNHTASLDTLNSLVTSLQSTDSSHQSQLDTLQPLTVTNEEVHKEGGTVSVSVNQTASVAPRCLPTTDFVPLPSSLLVLIENGTDVLSNHPEFNVGAINSTLTITSQFDGFNVQATNFKNNNAINLTASVICLDYTD